MEDDTWESHTLAFVDSEGRTLTKSLQLRFGQLCEADVDGLGVDVITVNVLDGGVDFRMGCDARVGGLDDGEQCDVLRAAFGGIDVMAGKGGKKCLEHSGASPKPGEVNMLDLFWVSDDESTELGGDEVDVSDR